MEKEEFEILIIKIRPKLLSVARNFALVSGIEADDVVQEALMALFFIISPLSSPMRQTSETVEIAQCIQQMVNLDMEDMISITATPIDECVWVRTELKDGSTKTFIMNRDENNKTTTLLAIN